MNATPEDQQLGDQLLIAAGFLAGAEMNECSIAVLEAYQKLFGELDIPSNTLAGALIAKAKLHIQQKRQGSPDN